MAERNTIMQRRDARVPVGRIAHELGRHPSTIYREISRNFLYGEDPWYRGYYSRVAHRKAGHQNRL
ncbi:IS30 family transposase [Novosphingobium sp. 1748]|nr:IS30 family transposase [Novosphingobium sp. 1748]